MLTTNEAAKRLGFSTRRLLVLIEHGRIPAEKVGRDWLLNEADVEAFAAVPRPTGRPRKDA
jgi:excisionase family DNA binding protein